MVLATALLYICVMLLSVTAYPPEYDSWLACIRDLGNLKGIEALPAFYAARHYLGSFGVTALMLSLLALIFTSLIGNISALSRLFYALSKDGVLPARFHRINRHGALCSGPAVMNLSLFSQAAIMTAASSSWQRCTTNPSKTSAQPKRWCPAGWRNTRLKRRPTSIRFLNRRTKKCIRKNNC